MKLNNTCSIDDPKGEESQQGIENLFEEIMTKIIPNLVRKKTFKSRKHRESQTR